MLCAARLLLRRLRPVTSARNKPILPRVLRATVPLLAKCKIGFLSPCRLTYIPASPLPLRLAARAFAVTRKPARRLNVNTRIPSSIELLARSPLLFSELIAIFCTRLPSLRIPARIARSRFLGSSEATSCRRVLSSYVMPAAAIALLVYALAAQREIATVEVRYYSDHCVEVAA